MSEFYFPPQNTYDPALETDGLPLVWNHEYNLPQSLRETPEPGDSELWIAATRAHSSSRRLTYELENSLTKWRDMRSFGAVILAASTSAALLVGAMAAREKSIEQNAAEACAPVTQQAAINAQDILDTPQKKFSPYPRDYTPKSPQARERLQHFRQTDFEQRKAAAKRYNLTVHDPTAYQTKLNPDGRLRTELPFQTFLSTTNDFLKPYGVKVSADTPQDALINSARHTTSSEQEAKPSKKVLYNIIEAVSGVPEEGIAKSGLKHIYLAYMPPKPARTPLKGMVTTEAYVLLGRSDMMVYNLVSGAGSDVFHHEWAHLRDCDNKRVAAHVKDTDGNANTFTDPAYEAHNAGQAYGQKKPVDLAAFTNKANKLNVEAFTYQSSDRFARLCRNARTIAALAKKVRWTSLYANTDVLEDKAETGSIITQPDKWARALNGQNPGVADKFATLFARFYQRHPKLAHYFADLSYRTAPDAKYDLDADARRICDPSPQPNG